MRGAPSAVRRMAGEPAGVILLAGLAGLVAVSMTLQVFPVPLALGALLVGGGVLLTLAFPNAATLVTLFAVYLNVTVIAAHRFEGVSSLAAGGVALLLLVPLAHHVVARGEPFRVDGVLGLMGAYLAVLLLSTFGAVDREVAYSHIFTYATSGLLLYVLVLNVVRDVGVVRRAVLTLLAAGALLSALSLYQSVTGSYGQEFGGLAARNLEYVEDGAALERLGTDDEMELADRAGGPVGGPNRFAQILIVLLPLALMEYRNAATPRLRLAAAGAGALILGGIFLTYSRGAFLTLVVLVLLLAALREIRWRWVILAAGLLAVGVGIVAPGYYGRIASVGEVTSLFDRESQMEAGAVMRGRITEMLAALTAYREHPITGVGPGQYTPFYSVEYQQRPENDFRHLPTPRRAHNLYAEVAAETGTPGLILFAAIPGLLLIGLWRERGRWSGRRPDLARLATGFGLAILAYHGTGVFLHLAYQRYYWLLLALAGAALHALRRTDAGEAGDSDRGPLPVRSTRAAGNGGGR